MCNEMFTHSRTIQLWFGARLTYIDMFDFVPIKDLAWEVDQKYDINIQLYNYDIANIHNETFNKTQHTSY